MMYQVEIETSVTPWKEGDMDNRRCCHGQRMREQRVGSDIQSPMEVRKGNTNARW